MRDMVDWSAGEYETTAAELAPAAEDVVARADPAPGEVVVDVACGTGNAALLAAGRGARVVGVDGAPRLLEVARGRARDAGLAVDFREGDLLALPVDDAAADVVLSVFGVIFAADPGAALREMRRILRPGARAFVTAWIPEGPIDAMLGAMGRIVGRLTGAPRPERFPWADPRAVGAAAAGAGLALAASVRTRLPIRAASPEAYVEAGASHPMAVTIRPVIERAGVEEEIRAAMLAPLREANEDPRGLLVHSPYVVHELRPA
jgi:SAM-dependent methyltransferase